jgi:hypothetical protein
VSGADGFRDEEEAPVPLGGLPNPGPPPEGLKARVLERLRGEGLMGGRSRTRPWLLPVAAGLVGVVLGASLRPAPALPTRRGPLFMLVFSGGPQSGEGLRQSILATRTWARTTAAGRIVAGQKLLAEGRVLQGPSSEHEAPRPRPDDFTPTGFFVVEARDLAEATALARSNPHLGLGGHLTVRAVDDLRWIPDSE